MAASAAWAPYYWRTDRARRSYSSSQRRDAWKRTREPSPNVSDLARAPPSMVEFAASSFAQHSKLEEESNVRCDFLPYCARRYGITLPELFANLIDSACSVAKLPYGSCRAI